VSAEAQCGTCGRDILERLLEVESGECQGCLRRAASAGVAALVEAYHVDALDDLWIDELWHHRNALDTLAGMLKESKTLVDAELVRRFRGDAAFRLGVQTLRVSPKRTRVVRLRRCAGLVAMLTPGELAMVFDLRKPRVKALREVFRRRGLPAKWAEAEFTEYDSDDVAKVSVVPEGTVKALDALPEGELVFEPVKRRGAG
jgi:hypothetical protein